MKTKSVIMALLTLGAAIGFMPGKAQAYENDYCREYTRTIYIGARQQEAYGTACLQPNGDWKIVDDDDGNRVGQRFRSEMVAGYTPVYNPVYQPVSQRYIYKPVPQRTRIIFVNGKGRYDDRGWHRGRDRHHDRWDHDRRDNDRWDNDRWDNDRRHR